MNTRNFKIRILNLTLTRTVFLDTGDAFVDVFNKYEKILINLGYQLISSGPTKDEKDGERRYTFHPCYLLKRRKKAYLKKPVKAYTSRRRWISGRPRRPSRDITLDVVIEIIRLKSKYRM